MAFDIDGNIYKDTREVEKIFLTSGAKRITAWLMDDKGDTLDVYENHNVLVRCETPPSPYIVSKSDSGAQMTNYVVHFANTSTDSSTYTYKWFIDDSLVSQSSALSMNFTPDSTYTLKVVINYEGLRCSKKADSAILTVCPKCELSIAGTKSLPPTSNKYSGNIFVAGLIYLLISIILATLILFYPRLISFYRASKNKQMQGVVSPERREPGKIEYTAPYSIEFKNQSGKIAPEAKISQLTASMRERHLNEIKFFDIPRSITATIRSGGFPFCVLLVKQSQRNS